MMEGTELEEKGGRGEGGWWVVGLQEARERSKNRRDLRRKRERRAGGRDRERDRTEGSERKTRDK